MTFDSCVDEIMNNIIKKYAAIGPKDEPQSVRAVIQVPTLQPLFPSIILDVGVMNFQGYTYALIEGWSICNPNLTDANTITANLLSLEELLAEYLDDEYEEDDDE